LNGEAQDTSGTWQTACFCELKILTKCLKDANLSLPKLNKYFVHTFSGDNFPTAARVASCHASSRDLVRAILDL
ncbi:hypothetical protein B9Z19DRAFT_971801, partial [Tuber borchii]